MRVENWKLNPDDLMHLVTTISLVDEPAMQVEWLALSKEPNRSIKLHKDNIEEFSLLAMMADEQVASYKTSVPEKVALELKGQNVIIAPAMIPNKLILRVDDNGEPFYGFFDAETISQAAYAFQKNKLTDSFNINHEQDRVAEGVFLAETWLVQDTELDKGYNFGYRVPKGTWMVMLKVENQDLYDSMVKTGALNGVSIEALVLAKVISNN